jgi:cysteine-rich repeat protein
VQRLALPLTVLTSIPLAFACSSGESDSRSTTLTTFTSFDETGDGDGDTGDSDGDTGDGDGDSGDGDGDGDSGDGDGDGDGDTAMCGDGVTQAAEECDDGNPVDGDDCTNACTAAVCGDGIVHEGVEMCDDGNDVDDDGCAMCMAGSCGDGVPQPGELCDDGNADNTDECAGCQPASCGDGYVQAGLEACDDGNDLDTDACIACVAASCGDGHIYAGMEECDDGNDVDTDNCPACSVASCGDGFVLQGQEGCDDGNNQSNDGCSAQCVAEVDPQCFQPYNEFDSESRINSFNDGGQTVYCDYTGGGYDPPDWVGPGWYRFTGAAGTQMATAAPGDYSCATHAACWLADPHPAANEGIVQRSICADWSPGDCWQTWEISVVNCGSFYLYNLPNTIACAYRYCGRN